MYREDRPNRILQIAGILLCLVLVSAHFTTGMYARFTSRSSAADRARIASFRVQITGAEEVAPPDESGRAVYKVTVSNLSEVAVSCLVELEFDEELSILEATFREGGNAESAVTIADDAAYKVGGNVQMAPQGSAELTFRLRFDTADLVRLLTINNTTLDANDNISTAVGHIDFTAVATFTQID